MSIIFEGDLWETYKQKLAAIESSNRSKIKGGTNGHYDGKYQFGKVAKKDIGLGHSPKERKAFRNDINAQEKALTDFTKLNYKRLLKNPKFAKMDTDQQMGVLAYAHNQGATGANNWLKTAMIGSDGFGTKGTKYYNAFTNKPAFNNEELKLKNFNYAQVDAPDRNYVPKESSIPLLRPDNLKVPVEPAVSDLVPQQTNMPQMRPDNLQEPNMPQLRPDNLSIQEQKVPQPQSFGQAFSQARKQHGGDGGVFEWNGNKYTTDIAKEVPAVAEPMFPREEFVPTVPPRVTSTADSRINVPPFEGLEIPELEFNNGTNSVPGYNRGTVMIDPNDPDKLLAREALYNVNRFQDSLAPPMPVQPERPFLDYDIAQEDLAFAQPIPQSNTNVNTPKEFVPQAQPGQQVQGGFGVPIPTEFSGGYKVESINAIPPGYDAGPAGTTVDAVPPGYNAGPVGTTINAVPPAYKAGPSVIPLADQFPTPGNDLMYKPENNTPSLFDSEGIHIPSGLSLSEMNMDQLKILVNDVQGDVDSVMIQKEIMKRVNQEYTTTQNIANQELQEDGAVSKSTLKSLDDVKTEIARQKEIETNLVFQDDWENRKKIRDKNRAEELYAKDLNKYKEHNLNLDKKVPEVKEEINLEDQFPTPGDDSMYEPPELTNTGKNTSSLVSENGLTLKNGIVVDSKGEEVGNPPPPPPEAKNKIEGLLKDYFGLEGKDIVKALGYYLMSRATGASHAGSMRWAGGVVLDSAAKREAKEDKLEAKNAKDKDTVDSLVKAGYTRASAESYVKTKLDDVLVKKGSTGMGVTKGDIKRIAVEGIDGYSNQIIYQQTRKLSDGNEIEIVRYFDPVEKTYKEVRLQDFENAIISSGGSLNMTPFSQKDMAKLSQDFVGTITTQLSSKLDEKNKGLIGNWTSSLNRYFQDQGYDMTDPRITSSLADLSYKAADRAIAFQAANKGKKVNDLSSFVKTMQLEATSMTANDSVWLAKNDKQIPQDKLAELNQVMFNEAEGNLSEVKAAFLSYITKFKTLDDSELLRLRPEKNENKFYVYLRNQLGL